MARKIIPQEFSASNGTGNKTRNYLDGPKNNSPIIFGRRVIVLTPTVIFLKTLWTAVPGIPGRRPGKYALSAVSLEQTTGNPCGTPAGRPLFVPPGVPGEHPAVRQAKVPSLALCPGQQTGPPPLNLFYT